MYIQIKIIFFRCLLKDRTLHYKPEKATAIINACVVLHNMCITYNIPLHENNIEEFDNLGIIEDILADDIHNGNIDLNLGRQQRNKVVTYLFQRNVA